MTEASAIMIPEASAITVDTSRIDVSEVETQQDKDFLMDRGECILQIIGRAALEVGEQIARVQDRFTAEGEKGLGKYYTSLGITQQKASRWARCYRAYASYVSIFGDDGAIEAIDSLGDVAAAGLYSLPTSYREALLADIALGNPPTAKSIAEISSRKEVKLSKAEELLAAAKVRADKSSTTWELAKADPEIETGSREYKSAARDVYDAKTSIANFEQQIADLKAEIEKEKLNTAEEAEEKARVEKELQKLKFDDAAARAERVKRVSSTLTLSVPQTLADVQKFFAERNEYPEEVQKHLLQQCTLLANYIGDQL